MRVFYDHQIFSVQQHGGISRYFTELIIALNNISGFAAVPGMIFSNNAYLHDTNLFDVKKFFPNLGFPGKNTLLYLLNKAYCSRHMRKKRYDLLHPTFFNPGCMLENSHKPLVVTFHDMIYERFPEMFPANDPLFSWKKEMAKKADKIIAVSMSTRDDLVSMMGVDERKVEVVYHGNSLWPDEPERAAAVGSQLPQNYILYVGRRDAHKNFPRFANVMASLCKMHKELTLICAGGGPLNDNERSMLFSLGMDKKVMQKDFDDRDLATVYHHALCLVFPSLYEGFGMPLLEAFACDCPVVCSNAGSLPEIADGAARFFDPLSETDMLAAVKSVVDDRETGDTLRTLGKARLKHFSWSGAAAKTHSLYKQLL